MVEETEGGAHSLCISLDSILADTITTVGVATTDHTVRYSSPSSSSIHVVRTEGRERSAAQACEVIGSAE